MKTIPAEKLNMVQALHFLHGLSQNQIVKITGLHYKQVESHIAKINKQILDGEISSDDVLATAESTNKRLGLENLVEKKIARQMPDIIGEDGDKIHPIMVSEASYNKMVEDVKETMNYSPENPGAACGNAIKESAVAVHEALAPFRDEVEAIFPIPVTSESAPYPVVVLKDIIDRLINKKIIITCLSISEEDFGMLSINWSKL